MSDAILLVEDNEDDVFALTRALKKANIANPVHLATDGKQAMDFLQSRIDPSCPKPLPFLIFLDLKLPYHSGFEILSWIRAQRSYDDVVVVILTSSAEIKDKQRAYAMGARTYIVKPPTETDIRDVMVSLLPFWSTKGIRGPNPGGIGSAGSTDRPLG